MREDLRKKKKSGRQHGRITFDSKRDTKESQKRNETLGLQLTLILVVSISMMSNL